MAATSPPPSAKATACFSGLGAQPIGLQGEADREFVTWLGALETVGA